MSLREKILASQGSAPGAGLVFRTDEIDQYEAFYRVLSEWNSQMNLVSPSSLQKAHAVHFLDSIFIADFLEKNRSGMSVSDLGSGAGFPGIVYAVRYPEVQVSLFEKLEKKRKFLSAVVNHLGLENVHVRPGLVDGKHQAAFTARAVYPPTELFKFFSKHLLAGSRFVLNIGGSTPEPPIAKGFKVIDKAQYDLGHDYGQRSVICYEWVPRGTK